MTWWPALVTDFEGQNSYGRTAHGNCILTPNLIPRKAKTNQTEANPKKKIVGTVYEHFWTGTIIMVFVGDIFSLKQLSTAVFIRYQIRMPWEYLTSAPSCQLHHISLKTHKWSHQFSHLQYWSSKFLTFLCRFEHTHSGWIVNHILSNECSQKWSNMSHGSQTKLYQMNNDQAIKAVPTTYPLVWKITIFNGKIHYKWAIFNSYFDITKGYQPHPRTPCPKQPHLQCVVQARTFHLHLRGFLGSF